MYTLAIGILFIISLPLCFVIAVMITCTSGLPVVFRQKRVGKDGKTFTMYKFRTMRPGAEKEQQTLLPQNESDGPAFKLRSDPRFTAIGKTLAHTGLDEIPQLYNVLRGDMALFGPRPLPVGEAGKLKLWQTKRHAIKPGIISPAILTGNYHENFDAWMKSDVAYTKEKSIGHDVRLAGRTVKFMARLVINELR